MAFVYRCLAGLRPDGKGIVVAANDREYPWSKVVLSEILESMLALNMVATRVVAEAHSYFLDDQPELRSGTIWCDVKSLGSAPFLYDDLPASYQERFYGRVTIPIPRSISLDGEPEQLALPI
jgi:hypothetical protein